MRKPLLCLLLFIIIFGANSCMIVNSETKTSDLLVYAIENYPEKRMLFFYDPINNSHNQILAGWDIEEFSLSKNYRLAFSSLKDGHSAIYVLDYPFTENVPTEIALGMPAENTPISWSPDGQYLLFDSVRTNSKKLSVWDGKKVSDIYEYHEYVQIYEWNEHSTKNISQNPPFHNGGQTWRNDGYWAFTTFFSSEQILYIKDNHNQTVLETRGQYQPAWSQSGILVFCVPEHPEWTLSIWRVCFLFKWLILKVKNAQQSVHPVSASLRGANCLTLGMASAPMRLLWAMFA